MAIRSPSLSSSRLTYDAYLAEGTVGGRYDIVDGVRIFMPAPRWRHQRIAARITRALLAFEEKSSLGLALSAPFDVLIRRHLLRTRQPDVLFISRERLRLAGIPEEGPLEVPPEIVVEIVSDSETERQFKDKIADYSANGVNECWRVHPETGAVEVLRLTPTGAESLAIYGEFSPAPTVDWYRARGNESSHQPSGV